MVNVLLINSPHFELESGNGYFYVVKRIFTSLFVVFVYSLSVIGMPLHYHYCKGELQHVTAFTQKECESHESKKQSPFACCLKSGEKHCDMALDAEEPDCCSDQSKWVQLDELAVAEFVKVQLHNYLGLLNIYHSYTFLREAGASGVPVERGPPVPAVARYIYHCSLVFYG